MHLQRYHYPLDSRAKKKVWSTNRCVLLTFFFNLIHGLTDGPTDLPSCVMQFYMSVMFLGLPDKINEEKPSFLQ